MNAVLLSVRPKYCELIGRGQKTIEVRRTKPKVETPFKVYIYETQGRYADMRDCRTFRFWDTRQKVIGEFVCNKVDILFNDTGNSENYMCDILPEILKSSAMTYDEFGAYVGSRGKGKNIYGWHISDLKIYEKPKALREFRTICKQKPCDKNCEFIDWERANNGTIFYECRYTGYIPIVRPPQSYMYVEER